MSVVIFLVILLVLVLVHEFGHFLAAKKFGMRVDEFGFGFPPKIFGVKKGETEYSFNLLPIGGFVKIFGENPNEENISGSEASRNFANKPKWQQAVVLFAGVFANFLLAWLLFSFGFMSGLPTSIGNEFAEYAAGDTFLVVMSVLPDSPAEKAGLRPGDRIISIKSDVNTVSDIRPDILKSFIISHGDTEIELGYGRGKSMKAGIAKIIPVKNPENGNPSIGITMDRIGIVKLPVYRAFWEGLKLDLSVTKGTAVGFFTFIKDGLAGKGSLTSVVGPVGIAGIAGDAYRFGLVYLISFTALISINLAIINLIPFPALDGGRLFFLLIEKIKGSRLNPKFANTANMVGFTILIIFMLAITYHDVVKLL